MDLSKTHCSLYCWISISRLFEHSSHGPTAYACVCVCAMCPCVYACTTAAAAWIYKCLWAFGLVCLCSKKSLCVNFVCEWLCVFEWSLGVHCNGANWPSELFPVKRKRKPPGMCKGQHAIYLGYGWFLKLAWGTSTHTLMLSHTHTQDTPAFCLKL